MENFNQSQNQEKKSDKLEKYLEFHLGNEAYAFDLLSIKEVIPIPQTTHLPNSPSYYVGIMNLRGQIISILDLRKKLNIGPKTEETEEAVIIVEIEGLGIGLVVDSINKVFSIKTGDVSEVPEVSSQINAQYIEGVYQSEENLTILLNLESIVNINEIINLRKKSV